MLCGILQGRTDMGLVVPHNYHSCDVGALTMHEHQAGGLDSPEEQDLIIWRRDLERKSHHWTVT